MWYYGDVLAVYICSICFLNNSPKEPDTAAIQMPQVAGVPR